MKLWVSLYSTYYLSLNHRDLSAFGTVTFISYQRHYYTVLAQLNNNIDIE